MRDVLIIDDDEVSRELLMLFVGEAGYEGFVASSGDEALALLKVRMCKPFAILADMQMEGTTGNALAQALRGVCGGGTRMIAMSGSGVKAGAAREFDGFLMKPMTIESLGAALEGKQIRAEEGTLAAEMLCEATYTSLAKAMPASELLKLYKMCLDDAERRIGLMRTACEERDGAAYERAAHAIKGGCGMVGALRLAALAGEMEKDGMHFDGEVEPLEEFIIACQRLRRMLDTRAA